MTFGWFSPKYHLIDKVYPGFVVEFNTVKPKYNVLGFSGKLYIKVDKFNRFEKNTQLFLTNLTFLKWKSGI